jgi:HlyD family secretion protein
MPAPSPVNLMRRAQNALERRAKEQQQSEALQQSPVWMRALTWSLMGTAAAAIAWVSLAHTEEIVSAPGKLEPLGSVNEVVIPVNGVVEQVLVKEGQRVNKGQVLLRMDTQSSTDKQASLQQNLLLKRQELDLKQLELARYLELNSTEQRMLGENLQLQQQIERRLEQLERQGASSEIQLLQQQNTVQEVKGKLEQTRADRLRQEAILEQAVKQLRAQISGLEADLSETNTTVRYQEVKAPVAGVVFDLKAKNPGYVSRGQEAALKVVPYDKLQARVEVPSSDIGFVRAGMPADISIDSFPATDFGVLQGTVRQVGSDALPPDQLNQTYRYPAQITLSSQQLKLKSGRSLPLQVGMSLTANVKLRKVSYLQLLLGSFKDKTDSLRKI